MGKRKYELDTRVLTVFFFVAMPFVALGSFLVVRMLFGRSHQRRGYWTLPALKGKAPGGREVLLAPARLVGYAPVEQVPNVKWLVVVEQELEEATAPIAGVTRYLWIHFNGGLRDGDPARPLLLVPGGDPGDRGGVAPARGASAGIHEISSLLTPGKVCPRPQGGG
jgi:hypothetical protein